MCMLWEMHVARGDLHRKLKVIKRVKEYQRVPRVQRVVQSEMRDMQREKSQVHRAKVYVQGVRWPLS